MIEIMRLLLFLFLKHYMFITECAGHTYGVECKQSCGNCSGGVQCDHVTGNCPNGCDAGMYGDRCDLGKARFKFNFFPKLFWYFF